MLKMLFTVLMRSKIHWLSIKPWRLFLDGTKWSKYDINFFILSPTFYQSCRSTYRTIQLNYTLVIVTCNTSLWSSTSYTYICWVSCGCCVDKCSPCLIFCSSRLHMHSSKHSQTSHSSLKNRYGFKWYYFTSYTLLLYFIKGGEPTVRPLSVTRTSVTPCRLNCCFRNR